MANQIWIHGLVWYDTHSFKEGTWKSFPFVSRGHQSNCKVTRTEKSICISFEIKRLVAAIRSPDKPCLFRVNDHLNICRFKQQPPAVAETWDITVFTHWPEWINTLRPRQNGRHFADDIFKWIFLTENVWILINISLKFVPMVQINDIPAFVQIMTWRRPGAKPLSKPMLLSSLTHIRVARPQWVKQFQWLYVHIKLTRHRLMCLWKEGCYSSVLAMELHLSCTNLSIWSIHYNIMELHFAEVMITIMWICECLNAWCPLCRFIQSLPGSCTIHRENQNYICFQGTHNQVTHYDKSDKQIVR